VHNWLSPLEKGDCPVRKEGAYELGLVIGKFLPPHHGHQYLIETAQRKCSAVTVIVCAKPTDSIPGPIRAAWLEEIVPDAQIMLIDDRYDENDSLVWAQNTLRWLGRSPDAVFTSENYGSLYASYMGCRHELVDLRRQQFPCSGTAVRANPFLMWEFISPPVRAWYAGKVVVVGAESTGTTTLAEDIARSLSTVWVREYGREYSWEKLKRGECIWSSEEFLGIAREHALREDAALRVANRTLVCDTDALATCLWHRRYMGFDNAPLSSFARRRSPHLYLLTGDEIPFIQDGLRDGEYIRHEMHRWFVQELSSQPAPWHLVTGDRSTRLLKSLEHIASAGLWAG
jgi:HTH-type transcriptional repressor of NAD biosynthesis genes